MKNLYFGILLNEKVHTNSKTSVKKFGRLANQFHQICDFILHSLTYVPETAGAKKLGGLGYNIAGNDKNWLFY